MLKLHLGCGNVHLPGYVNCDIERKFGVDRVCDARRLTWGDDSVDFIYSCALIEEFGRYEWVDVLKHWCAKLVPGGVLRLSTSDFAAVCEWYVQHRSLEHLPGLVVGGQRDRYSHHGMVFDFQTLKAGLLEAGFVNVHRYDWRETDVGQLGIDDFSQAYLPHMDKEHGKLMALNVEATKPLPGVEIVVASWDRAANCWEPFAWAFERHWPDRPWRARFITNELDAPLDGAIKLGGDETRWTPMQRAALEQIESDVVFHVSEDVWLVHSVDTGALRDFAAIVQRGEADVVRIFRSGQAYQGGVGSYEPDPRLYMVDPFFPYFTNTQASFWNRKALLSILGPDDEPPDHFETTGSARARTKGLRVLCVDAATTPDQGNDLAFFPTIDAVCRGRWRLSQRSEQLGEAIEDAPCPDEVRRMTGWDG
jgi:predicted SAM-dependent methyltransferase